MFRSDFIASNRFKGTLLAFALGLNACAPLPTREDKDAFQSKLHGAVAKTDTGAFMECVIDEFGRTENALIHEIKTTQQRRATSYRVERRWELKETLILVSADISDSGDVELFENIRLPRIAPFVSTKEELAAFEKCLGKFRSPK